MKAQSLWIPKGLLFLWLHLKVCYGSLDDTNQVCVKKSVNSSTPPDCYEYGWANFGDVISSGSRRMGVVVLAEPSRTACSSINTQSSYNSSGYNGNWFLLIDADDCEFDSKAARATEAGFDAAIIWNTKSDVVQPIAWHSEAERRKVSIPVIYVAKDTGYILEDNDFKSHRESRVFITAQEYPPIWDYEFYMIPFAIIVGICFILMAMFMISRYYRHYLEQRRNRLSPTNLKKIPTKKFKKGDDYYDVCAICLEEYKEGERLRILPCDHAYHCKCVDPWLTEGKRTCPVCKRPVLNDKRSRNKALRTDVEANSAETTQDADETTPLIQSTSASVASSSMTV